MHLFSSGWDFIMCVHEVEFAITGSSICLPGGLPHETLGVFSVCLLGVLAGDGAYHIARPGVGCLPLGNLLASGLPDGMIAMAV